MKRIDSSDTGIDKVYRFYSARTKKQSRAERKACYTSLSYRACLDYIERRYRIGYAYWMTYTRAQLEAGVEQKTTHQQIADVISRVLRFKASQPGFIRLITATPEQRRKVDDYMTEKTVLGAYDRKRRYKVFPTFSTWEADNRYLPNLADVLYYVRDDEDQFEPVTTTSSRSENAQLVEQACVINVTQ